MVIKLNWNLRKIPKLTNLKPDIVFILLASFIWFNTSAQEQGNTDSSLDVLDTIVAKTSKIIIEEDTLPVYSISVGKFGSTFPCGARFGISLQAPGYHIFSAESAFNATLMPDDHEIKWPDGGADKNSQVYQNTFKRIKAMKVGTVEGSFGKRWTISAEQFKANYSNLFDIELDGQQRFAGDYNNMFFEMLISIQQLAKENDKLKSKLSDTESRLTAIEAKLDLSGATIINQNLIDQLKISPNPSDNGMLNIEFSINEEVEKAFLFIFDLNGKSLYKTAITDRGTGNITQFFDLIAGVYFYQLVTDGYKGETVRLVIN